VAGQAATTSRDRRHFRGVVRLAYLLDLEREWSGPKFFY
jgi:hypothetical protein